ncbi:MAG: efflux RND transporter permease subunit [Planctomycetota bacterium]
MRGLARVCVERPVFATMLVAALVVAGAAGYAKLGIDRFPQVDLPTVGVRTALPGASPEEVEVTVSQPLEEAVNTVDGIAELRSISSSGASFVLLTFELERDIDSAAQDVRDRVAGALRRLPRDIEAPQVFKLDNDSSPVMTVAVSGPRTIRELTELADKKVKPFLERSAGVGQVELVGGLERAVNIWLEADRLAAFRMPVTTVRDALVRQNSDVPGGLLTDDRQERTLRTMGRYAEPGAFGDLVLETRGGVPIRVRDVGRAEDGTKEQRTEARLDGQQTVVLEVRRQSSANTVAVTDGCKAALVRAQALLPADISVDTIIDQSRYIRAALHEINVHLLVGSLLATLVVLLFMRNLRATIIAAVAIPTSVVATFGVMWTLDFTLNGVTMLALVLMVGVVIDDAIVVLENIYRFVEEKGMAPMQAAKAATAEIALAVLATTFSLVVIFVPVSFMSSVSGRFLFQFGITAAAAVLVSLLVSFTLTPMMSARLVRVGQQSGGGGPDAVARSRRGFYARIERGYLLLLRLSMRYRIVVLLLCVGAIASTWPLYHMVRQDYIPSDVDEGEFEIRVRGPESASFKSMRSAMLQAESELRALPQVRHVLATIGGGFLGGVGQGSFFVQIQPHAERRFSLGRLWRCTWAGEPWAAFRGNYTQSEVMSLVRQRLRRFKELRCSVRNARSFNIGGGNFDIDLALLGPELDKLLDYGRRLQEGADAIGGIVDTDTTLRLDKPELRVSIDRQRAADLGVATDDVASALRLLVGGDPEVSRYRDPALDEEYDVQLRLAEVDRNETSKLGSLLIPRRNGEPVRLDNLVGLVPAVTPSRIDRLDRQRQNSLRAGIAPGFALADRIAALRQVVDDLHMAPGYSSKVAGRARELERTFAEFVVAFALSLAFMYMILASQFESVVHPLTILVSLPIAVPFALFSLWATDNTLNLYSALGILVLFGVVKKNSILQIDHINNLRAKGRARTEAILEGNRDRLRPILMTTLALVAGMLPLALGAGPGAEERKAIAVVVIGGQTLALVLTLLATPVVYSLLDDLAAWWRRPQPAEVGRNVLPPSS